MSELAPLTTHAGFPNAADDTRLTGLSLDALLVPQPRSTYFFRVSGDTWEEQGIFDGDIAIVNRALTARPGDRTIWWHADAFHIGYARDMQPDCNQWGRVTSIVHIFS